MLSDRPASVIPSITATPSSPNLNHPPTTTKSSMTRPTSEVLNHKLPISLESEALEKWVEDLAQYERTLEEMAKASLDPSFKEELGAVENWFSALSEAEKTAALYSLLHQSTNLQVRFFITVLQKMTKDPVREILSPGYQRSGLLTFGEYSNQKKNQERHSMPASKSDIPRPISLGLDYPFTSNPRLSLKNQNYHSEENLTPGWRRSHSPGHTPSGSSHRISSLDLKGMANWGLWEANNPTSTGRERSLSAVNAKEANWGHLGKNRNSNHLGLKLDPHNTGGIPLDVDQGPSTNSSSKPLASPSFPPGLPTQSQVPTSPHPKPQSQVDPTSTSVTPATPVETKDPKPLDQVDFEVLENIPAWMRSLRLHKYTTLLEAMPWQRIVTLSDQNLIDLGVEALGARRKFLKVFDHVKQEAATKGISIAIPTTD